MLKVSNFRFQNLDFRIQIEIHSYEILVSDSGFWIKAVARVSNHQYFYSSFAFTVFSELTNMAVSSFPSFQIDSVIGFSEPVFVNDYFKPE